MTEKVVPLQVVNIGAGRTVEVSKVLEAAGEANLDEVVVLGWGSDGPYVAGSEGHARVLWVIEKCKLALLGVEV